MDSFQSQQKSEKENVYLEFKKKGNKKRRNIIIIGQETRSSVALLNKRDQIFGSLQDKDASNLKKRNPKKEESKNTKSQKQKVKDLFGIYRSKHPKESIDLGELLNKNSPSLSSLRSRSATENCGTLLKKSSATIIETEGETIGIRKIEKRDTIGSNTAGEAKARRSREEGDFGERDPHQSLFQIGKRSSSGAASEREGVSEKMQRRRRNREQLKNLESIEDLVDSDDFERTDQEPRVRSFCLEAPAEVRSLGRALPRLQPQSDESAEFPKVPSRVTPASHQLDPESGAAPPREKAETEVQRRAGPEPEDHQLLPKKPEEVPKKIRQLRRACALKHPQPRRDFPGKKEQAFGLEGPGDQGNQHFLLGPVYEWDAGGNGNLG